MPVSSAKVLGAPFDVCVVGAGPAGLACAFACHDRGLRVLVLDAGAEHPSPGSADLLAAQIVNPSHHDPVEIVSASALGGSSHWWAGRCVPLDPVDFRSWPIRYEDMVPWWRHAGELLGCGSLVERPPPGKFARLKQFHASSCESWSPDPGLRRRWRNRIEAADGPAIVLGARVTGLRRTGARISDISVRHGDVVYTVTINRLVLACGGLAGLRLMLLAQRTDPDLFGGPDGPLGRGYMGHLTGSIADLVPADRADAEAFGHFDASGSYVARRRILPLEETVTAGKVGNIAFWLDQPLTANAAHGSAATSARYVAARSLGLLRGGRRGPAVPLGPHLANIVRAPIAAAIGLGQAAWLLAATRLTRQRFRPRRFRSSGGGGWRMVYHAEQASDPQNRVSLCDDIDSIGLPRIRIDFRFSAGDIDSVVRAHRLLDADLRAAGIGALRWTAPADESHRIVIASARDGYHQLGGAIMSSDPARGVVDRNCRVHGIGNLWVVSGSVFPSGGQANPTLTIIALACRAADHIARFHGAKRPRVEARPIHLPPQPAAERRIGAFASIAAAMAVVLGLE